MDQFKGAQASSIPRSSTDKYWEMTLESVIRQALRLYALQGKPLSYTAMTNFIIRYGINPRPRDPGIRQYLATLNETPNGHSIINKDICAQLTATHAMWENLSDKPKSVLQSMITPLIDSLNSPVAKRIFACGQPCKIPDAVERGGIVLISLDAIRYPEVARLLGCIAKGQFYDTVLQRNSQKKSVRPVGLILDDWILSCMIKKYAFFRRD